MEYSVSPAFTVTTWAGFMHQAHSIFNYIIYRRHPAYQMLEFQDFFTRNYRLYLLGLIRSSGLHNVYLTGITRKNLGSPKNMK